ncbi:hypothetical protein RclHR1_08320001 [Rhizophagus clarus]|jgi:hypothetical protein|uniref:Uncharacterized protein n=1 Tax=Rhizophagus clarus TaxID=94130 RepID=A0A2Z6SFL5_9GLOM|nr:hypothetical protein RclHR1_08320001 [Rhizophagus clarus]
MNSHIRTTLSAPVVQSRLEHHHNQQLLNQTEARNQFNRSKSLNNKGKRGFSYNHHQQKVKETTISSSSENTIYSRNSNKNFSNYSNNFDSSYHREQSVGYSNFLVDNGSVGQLQRKTSNSNRPARRHQHSDSVDEDKFRVITPVSILKRPQSATDFVKSSNSKSIPSLDVTKEDQIVNHHRPNSWEKSPPQKRSQSKERRRSDVTPSRSKRTQRKEIRSMEFDTDLMLNANTIQLLSSGDESDVNSNKYVKSVSSSHNNNTITPQPSAFIFPPLNYSNAIIALEEEMNSNKKEDTYSNSDDNILIKSNKKRSDHYIESTPRRLSSTAIELQSQVSRFASDSDSDSSARRPPSSSPARLGAPKLYAGPTFHNSPAPSDLPMPSFYGKSLGKESSPLSSIGGNNLFTVPENTSSVHISSDNYSSPSSGNTSDDDMFAMDDLEQSRRVPYYPGTSTLRKQKSRELLRMLTPSNSRQHQTAAAYMVPERMATAHHPMHVYPSNDLNELSENLRSLLKIHGQ